MRAALRGISRATSDMCKTREERKQAQAKMSDSKNRVTEAMPAGVGNFISFNHKYKKIICSGSGCGMAIAFDELGQHLGRKHHVGTGISDQVTKVARKLGWEETLPGDVRPEDGMAPQVGLSVWDGV